MDWKWIFSTSIRVCHHGQAFSNLVLFLNVALFKLRCIFALGPSSSPSNSFSILLIYSAFQLCSLSSRLFLQNFFVSLSSGCWYVFVYSPLLAGRIFFRCFGMSCFISIILSCLDTFWFISLSFCGLFYLWCFFAFHPNILQCSFSVLSFLLVDFLSMFSISARTFSPFLVSYRWLYCLLFRDNSL